MIIDLNKIIRSRKPEKRHAQLTARPDTDLICANDVAGKGRIIFVPDSNIYIMDAAGILSQAAEAIVDQGLMFHCSVCLAEICAGIGKYSPSAVDWQQVADHYRAFFASIPSNRLIVPDAQTWADAGVVAGILARTQGFQTNQSKELLNDAVIYLSAAKAELPILTENKNDFDLLQQLVPSGRFVFV